MPDSCNTGVQAVAVCAAEAKVGGVYIAVVTEPAAALPEVADVEEEAELGEEAPIAPPGPCPPCCPAHSLPVFCAPWSFCTSLCLLLLTAERACLPQNVLEQLETRPVIYAIPMPAG